MKIEALIWDIDGTLLNTLPGLVCAYKYSIERLSLAPKSDSEIASFIGPTPQTIFKEHFGLQEPEAQAAADIFRSRYKEADLYKASVYEGIIPLLQKLKAMGLPQAVATNKRQDYAIDILQHFGLAPYLDPIYGIDNLSSLTKADLIKKCLAALKLKKPSSAVMVGDTEGDLKAAEEAGVSFIGVNYGFGFQNEEGYADTPLTLLELLVCPNLF